MKKYTPTIRPVRFKARVVGPWGGRRRTPPFENGPAKNDSRWKRAYFASSNALRSCAPNCKAGQKVAEVPPKADHTDIWARSPSRRRGHATGACRTCSRSACDGSRICRGCALCVSAPRPRKCPDLGTLLGTNSAKQA